MEEVNCTLNTTRFRRINEKTSLLPQLNLVVRNTILLLLVLLTNGMFLQSALAQSPQASISQGNNGSSPNQVNNPVVWVNGNLNESQNHHIEGQSIPYRAVLDRFKTGCETKIRIAFDVRRNSHMAIDYLTSNNWYGAHATVFPSHPAEAVNPLDGLTGTFSPASFYPLPAPGVTNTPVPGQGQASYNTVAAAGKNQMSINNGTISNITWVTQPNYLESNASFEAVIEVTFTATALPVVLSWGGHIASRVDWGYIGADPRSAGGIPGSPYHMRLLDWDVTGINASSCNSSLTTIGSQDRSLQISAPPCQSITADIVADYTNYNDNSTIGLQANVTGGFAPYTYAWSSVPTSPIVSFNSTTIANPIVTIGNTQEITFTVLVTDAIGCQVSKTFNIPSPGPLDRPCGIEGPSEVCPNTSSLFSFPHPAATSVSWSVTGNGSINGTNLGTPVTVVSSNVCGGTYTVIVTAVYPNATVTCSTTVNVLTPLVAAFATPPGDVTVDCGAIPSLQSLSYTNGTASGGCGINGSVMAVRSGTFTVCGGTLTDTWTFTDICGRTITASRTITVRPAAAATYTSTPGNIVLASCATALPATSTLNYTNGLSGGCEISGTSPMSQIVLTSGTAPCARVFTETWTSMDPCQRTITHSRTISVPAAAAAAFVNAPGATTVSCANAPTTATSTPLSYSNGLAGACAISGTSNSVVTGSSNACGGSFTETWSFADPCGRGTITHSRIITVSPAALPAFVNAPGNTSVECSAVTAIGSLSYTNSGTGSCLISGSIQGIRTGSYTYCGGTLTDTWTIPAPCPGGQPIVHSRTITVLPAPKAEFVATTNIEIACSAAPPTGSSLAYTNGGASSCLISGTATGVITGSHNACGGSYTETWTFVDACNRTSTKTRTITVLPAPKAEFVATANIEIACSAAPPTGTSLAYTNGGANSCLISGTTTGVITGSHNACGGSYTETWTFVDACNRTSTKTRTITVLPAPKAEFVAAANLEIACSAAPPTGTSLAYTNGGANSCLISGTATGVITGSHNACGGSYTETWTFVDACNRTSTKTRTITVLPAPKAEFVATANIEIACSAAPPTGTSLAYTNGGASSCLISGTRTGVITGSHNACGGSYTETWTFVDACNRTSTASRTITVLPAPKAEFVATANIEIACSAAPPTGTSLAYTNGGANSCLISGTRTGVITGSHNACGGSYTETWTFVDACNRTSTATRTITVLPAPKAEFVATANIEIACSAAPPTGTSLAYTNGGASSCLISGTRTGVITGSHNACGGSYTETWTFVDACNRTSTKTRTITVLPAPKAEFVAAANLEIACSAAPPTGTSLAYTNGGATSCLISGTATGVITGSHNACGGSYTETWTFVDACNRTSTRTRTISVLPAPKAEFATAADLEIACSAAPPTGTSLAYTNGGATSCLISGTRTGVITGSHSACGGSYTETWTFVDACNRTSTRTRTITVLPAPKAEFVATTNIEIACSAAPPTGTSLAYTNGGANSCLISGTRTGVITGSHNACGGSYTETWTFVDACNRTSTQTRTITVLPAPKAEFVATANIEIACSAAPPTGTSLAYTNGGANSCLISGTRTGVITGSHNACGGSYTETWTFVDACNRTSTQTRTITVLPAPKAEFVATANIEIACSAAPPTGTSLAYTNGGANSCLISGTATGVITGSHNACGGSYTETWTFVDACNRTSTKTRTITVLPAPKAEFVATTNLEIACSAAPPTGTSLAYTNGGANSCLISGTRTGVITGSHNACGGSYTETWTFVDACNRTSTKTRTITVLPAPKAEFVATTNLQITCSAAPPTGTSLAFTNGGAASCLISGTRTGVITGSHNACGGSYTETWTLVDACNRTSTRTRTITVLPAPAPTFTNPPGNIEATICGEAPLSSSLSYSNGLQGTCSISGSVMSVISGGTANNCGTYTETWTFNDPCGRAAITHSRTIEVPCCKACTYTQGAYGSTGGNHCNGDGTTSVSLVQIQRALQNAGTPYILGSTTTNRYWTLNASDASNIMNQMLPGGGNSQKFGQRVGGGTYSQSNTWSVAPLQAGGPNTGKIKNTLFAQTLTLFLSLNFDVANGARLGNMILSDTMITKKSSDCGPTGEPTGNPDTFAIPHAVMVYLNSSNVDPYPTTVYGLFKLANDVLGGVVTDIDPSLVANAVDVVNNAFDECRFLVGRVAYAGPDGLRASVEPVVITDETPAVEVTAHPNPFTDRIVFTIKSKIAGNSSFELYGLLGEKVTSLFNGYIEKDAVKTLIYEVSPINRKTMIYQLRIGKERITGKVIYPN